MTKLDRFVFGSLLDLFGKVKEHVVRFFINWVRFQALVTWLLWFGDKMRWSLFHFFIFLKLWCQKWCIENTAFGTVHQIMVTFSYIILFFNFQKWRKERGFIFSFRAKMNEIQPFLLTPPRPKSNPNSNLGLAGQHICHSLALNLTLTAI